MKNDFQTQTEDFFRTAADARVPESVQHFAEDSVAKTREAYAKMTVAAQETHKALSEVAGVATTSAKALGEKVLANVAANTEAAFDAAEAIARARSVPEALRLQQSFVQSQMAKAGEQTREFFELSTKLTQQTFASFNAVASRSVNGALNNVKTGM
jgi:phasin